MFDENVDCILENEQQEKPKEKRTGKRVSLPVFCLAIFLSLAVGFGGAFSYFWFKTERIRNLTLKLEEVDALVQSEYFGDTEDADLTDGIIEGYLTAIGDKYSFYQNSEDAKAVADSFSGDTSGIGVTVAYEKSVKGLYIIRVDFSGPADKAGLQTGDIITSIDGKTVGKLGYKKAVNAIKRAIGEKVELTYLRDGEENRTELLYEEFVRQSVYYHIIDNVGYMLFTGFNSATVEQFKVGIEDLTDKNVKGIIFDLRGNGGGTVSSVCEILDILLPQCDIMTVEYANGEKKVLHTSDENEVDLPFAVLTDEDTASAAELFAAAVRDTGKGVLIGDTTYGKGVMQNTFFLSDDSCVRFTTGTFYPPSGVCFNEVGLEPDYEITYTEEQTENFYKLGDSDPAVVKAKEYINGK